MTRKLKHGCARNNKNTHYLYRTWSHIKGRCYNIKDEAFRNYGGRGIFLYKEWHEFINFKDYVDKNLGDRPTKCSFDRINNNGNYEPNNVRWATQQEQQNNRRDNRLITINGQVKTFEQWCRDRNIPSATVWNRIRSGMNPAKALEIGRYKIWEERRQ